MRLLLVRHGQTRSNVDLVLDTAFPGADLDEVGRGQAEALVERLAHEPIDAIAVSDLTRTAQTAAPLAAARGLTPLVRPGLREIPAGEDEMSSQWQRYVQMLQGWATDPHGRIPGGESGVEFMARFEGALADLVGLGHDHLLVVSHGAALRTWATARLPGFVDEIGHRGLPNTTVIVAEGLPGDGWRLAGISLPENAL